MCGKESEDFLCAKCASERLRLASIDKLELVVCSRCGRYKVKERWKKLSLESALSSSLKVLVDEKFEVDEVKVQKNLVTIHGRFAGEELKVSIPFNYRIVKICCPRCSRESGGYYEAIVQLRAEGRKVEESEVERAVKIINSMLKGEKNFFREEFRKEGIDFYFGSKEIAKRISKQIAEEFGGYVLETKKLHTKIDGKDVYRFTYLVKLPAYKTGDVVEVEGKLAVVKSARKGVEILSGKTLEICKAKLVARKDKMKKGYVVNFDENVAEVMSDFGLLLVPKPVNVKIGSEVFVFEYNGRFYSFESS